MQYIARAMWKDSKPAATKMALISNMNMFKDIAKESRNDFSAVLNGTATPDMLSKVRERASIIAVDKLMDLIAKEKNKPPRPDVLRAVLSKLTELEGEGNFKAITEFLHDHAEMIPDCVAENFGMFYTIFRGEATVDDVKAVLTDIKKSLTETLMTDVLKSEDGNKRPREEDGDNDDVSSTTDIADQRAAGRARIAARTLRTDPGGSHRCSTWWGWAPGSSMRPSGPSCRRGTSCRSTTT